MKNAADAMCDASHMIEIHEVCATAGNGAPDCACGGDERLQGQGLQ